MTAANEANQDQVKAWNETSGRAWVEMQRPLERMLAPFATLLIEKGLSDSTRRVLDVGCGWGATTFAAARRIGPGGSCVGVDVSTPLLELAQARAREEHVTNVSFVRADAQTHAFEPNDFDAVISRFGVMFFDDPIAAFANIKRAARPGAALTFVAWRSPAENPFMTAAARAAAPILSLPAPDPNAPGQFALADAGRVREILQRSGWKHVELRPIDIPCTVAQSDLLEYVTKLGPVGAALRDVTDPELRARTVSAVRGAFTPFIHDGEARFDAACWLTSARA
ncbi:MAG TPA: class I SAM-dependent methyltransferase [Steroidobacteraceae bacterium]|nr:class I SAM-dependent methyltransferase [Steroidobacteraceae bacterium]